MLTIEVGCDLQYTVRQPSVFVLQIAAAANQYQVIDSEQLTFDPGLPVEALIAGREANRLHRITVLPCQLSIRYRATMQLHPQLASPAEVAETPFAQIPPAVLTYLNPSRYAESDLLARFAFEEFGQIAPGYGRVQAICDWVHGQLDYTPGSTTGTTTAADVLLQRTGVCRDYAHLTIALCRAIGIPARYVAGYAVDLQPPDFHGFLEAYLDGQWYLFDPTGLAQSSGLVRIGTGRDAADVAFATLTGHATLQQKSVWANLLASQTTTDLEQISSDGVSTA